MICSETEPCPIYLDLARVYPLGRKLFAAGSIHSAQATLYSILLVSEDEGATWNEGVERVRGSELDHIQFTNFETGWVSGQRVMPLPGDPFLLLTTDGGKNWRKEEILPEGSAGSVQKIQFDTPKTGTLLIDRGGSDGERMRYSRYETMTGGTSWMIRETSEKPLQLPDMRTVEEEAWRVRADAAAKLLRVEKKTPDGWTAVAQIALELSPCKGVAEPEKPAAPPTETESATPQKDYLEELHLGSPHNPSSAPKKKKK